VEAKRTEQGNKVQNFLLDIYSIILKDSPAALVKGAEV
jgi:hypothetical protein